MIGANIMMKAILVRGDSLSAEDVIRIACSEGKKLFRSYDELRVPWLQFVEKLNSWIVVVESVEVKKKLDVSERASVVE